MMSQFFFSLWSWAKHSRTSYKHYESVTILPVLNRLAIKQYTFIYTSHLSLITVIITIDQNSKCYPVSMKWGAEEALLTASIHQFYVSLYQWSNFEFITKAPNCVRQSPFHWDNIIMSIKFTNPCALHKCTPLIAEPLNLQETLIVLRYMNYSHVCSSISRSGQAHVSAVAHSRRSCFCLCFNRVLQAFTNASRGRYRWQTPPQLSDITNAKMDTIDAQCHH